MGLGLGNMMGIGRNKYGKLIMDLFPATETYSLRLTRTAFKNEGIVRVRRDNDDDEVFVKADLTFRQPRFSLNSPLVGSSADFGDFIGSNNGFVTNWASQMGTGNNATQSIVGNQPQIVSSGSVITEGGNPTVQYDGSDDFMDSAYFVSDISQLSAFIVQRQRVLTIDTISVTISEASGTQIYMIWYKNPGSNPQDFYYVYNVNSGVEINVDENTDFRLDSFTYDSTNGGAFYVNGSSIGSINTGNTGASTRPIRLGGYSKGGLNSPSNISEFIIYNSDQSSNRTAIEGNIANHYGITLA